jgi:solute carrier family 10 (sodium/bile acid cotransporter), member 7
LPDAPRAAMEQAMFRRLIPDPFIIAILAAVTLASLAPARGDFAIFVGWLATATIVLLFFFHGAKLSREAVFAGLVHWRLHLTILACTFLMFPLLGLALAKAFPGLLPPTLWTGILYLCALPATVQSAIAFTSIARGNVPAAIASSSASQLLGVVLTPIIAGLITGAHGASAGLSGMGEIMLQILAPFVVGHLLRPWIGEWVTRNKGLIGITDRSTIVIAVYSAFSAAVIEGIWSRVPIATLGVLVIVCAIILAFALGFTALIGRVLGFPREDRIAIQFCGTKKSIIQGVPMARVLFAGPDVGIILLPLMIFHQMQLMACAWLARRYAVASDEPSV